MKLRVEIYIDDDVMCVIIIMKVEMMIVIFS